MITICLWVLFDAEESKKIDENGLLEERDYFFKEELITYLALVQPLI